MDQEQDDSGRHYRALEHMYLSAPCNNYFKPAISVAEGLCEIEIDARQDFFHAAGAVHGSVYFKMLDDSAFFAANSLEPEVFVLTTSFTTYLTRPVSQGRLKAVGKVVNRNKTQFICEAVVYDGQSREIGRGSGVFVRSKGRLCEIAGYSENY